MTDSQSISLSDQKGVRRTLSEFKGSFVVLYFYPKDFTPGCTQEACDFRDASAELEQLGATVVAVSKDKVESHAKFADKHTLGFVLLSDPLLELIQAFEAYGTKNQYGRKVEGVKRTTVLLGPDGTVLKRWNNVRVSGHVQAVLQELRKHLGADSAQLQP